MAVAEIYKVAPNLAISSPQLALVVNNRVAVDEKGDPLKTNSKGLMTKQSPVLTPSDVPPKLDPKDSSFLNELVKYMTLILQALVQLSQDQSKINQAQTNLSGSLVDLGKIMAQKAADDLKKVVEAEAAASHQSWLSKVLGGIAGGLCCVIGLLTCDPALVLAGVFTLAMTYSGGSEAFNNSISGLCPALKGLALAGMCIGAGVCLAGASSCMTAALSETAVTATEEAAPTIAETVASSAEDEIPAAAELSAEAEEAAPVANNASSAAKNASTTVKNTSTFTVRNTLAMSLQQMSTFNFSTELARGIVDGLRKAGAHISQDAEELGIQIAGAIVAAVAGGAGMAMSTGSIANLSAKLAEKVGEGFVWVSRIVLELSRAGFSITSAAYGIKAGVTTLHQADIIDDMGQAQSLSSIYTSLTDSVNTSTQHSIDSFKDVSQTFAAIGNRWIQFVSPYSYAAEIMG